jgi:hypothetical protein
MNKRYASAAVVPLVLLAAALACSPSPATDTPAAIVATLVSATFTSPAPSQSSTEGGECSNDYFPTDAGSTWEYTSTSGGAPPQSRTVTIAEERGDGFSVEIGLASVATFDIEWSCSGGDLTQLTPTASLSMAGTSSTVTATSHSGVTLPADLDTILSWQESGAWSVPMGASTTVGTFAFDTVVTGAETIAVPFDTLEAMRVESQAEGTLNGEPTAACHITQWWAKDVGLVKQETTCILGGQAMTEVLELVSYDSP